MVELSSIPIINQMILPSASDMLSNLLKEIVVTIIVGILSFLFRKKLYEYLKNLYEWLLIKRKQLIVFIRLVPRFWIIGYENSRDYKRIDFHPYDPYIKAPYLDFKFYITNRSIFDLKTKNFFMKIINQPNGSEIGQINTLKEICLPHQSIKLCSLRQDLDLGFIEKLKLNKELKTQKIILSEVKIDLIGDKEFCMPYEIDFNLRIPADEINVS